MPQNSSNDDLCIRSAGDLEVVLLYENHSLLAELISPDYYSLLDGTTGQIQFQTRASFLNFYTLVNELFSKGSGNVELDGRVRNWSLLDAAGWFCDIHDWEAENSGLKKAYEDLNDWVSSNTRPNLSFYCGNLLTEIEFDLTRAGMINFAANLHKHSLLRLGMSMKKLRRLCAQANLNLGGLDIVDVREEFIAELDSRLVYLSSWLVELLGAYFLALNYIIRDRYLAQQTNHMGEMEMPAEITSDSLRNLYGSTLAFKSYEPARISRHVPKVDPIMKLRY